MKSYNIHFIRHGAIEDTLNGVYIGTTDAPLSDENEKIVWKRVIGADENIEQSIAR